MTAFHPKPQEIKSVVLRSGDFHFGCGPTRISTLLGSCVSITLWHPRRRIGGMCHYMLTDRRRPPGTPPDGRYANEAFELFLQHVAREATTPTEYQAKLFGGARMFDNAEDRRTDIGAQNIEYGRKLLSEHSITLISSHVGGSGRRKLYFDLWSGEVWLAFPEGEGARTSRAEP